MRCGCISLGNIKCDGCRRVIPYPSRYLSIVEAEGKQSLCAECCLEKGLAQQSDKEGDKITFKLE